jgi:hypothetical protein
MNRLLCLAVAIIVLVAGVDHASAQAPSAIVEEIEGSPPNVEKMDYLSSGKVIELGPREKIVISYFKSCYREIITGSTIIVGGEQSEVRGGSIYREKTLCDGGKMELSVELSGKTGGMVLRDTPKRIVPPLLSLRPQFLLYGRSPLVELARDTPVIVERVDQPGERYELPPGGLDQHPSFYDFAKENKALSLGGVYRATMGSVQILFQVDVNAMSGYSPLVGRLLRLRT